MNTNLPKAIFLFISFLASGFLSGAIIHWTNDADGFEIWYVAGLIFGIAFVLCNSLLIKKPPFSFFAIILSTGAYYLAVLSCVTAEFHPTAVGAVGATAVSLAFMFLFKIKIPFVIAAIVAGAGLGTLMLITDMDDGYQLAYTFSAWQGVVGLLLSLGLKKEI